MASIQKASFSSEHSSILGDTGSNVQSKKSLTLTDLKTFGEGALKSRIDK